MITKRGAAFEIQLLESARQGQQKPRAWPVKLPAMSKYAREDIVEVGGHRGLNKNFPMKLRELSDLLDVVRQNEVERWPGDDHPMPSGSMPISLSQQYYLRRRYGNECP